jgi:hypothetical protein
MPSPLSLVQKFDAVTGPFAYFRLLGDRAELDAPTLDHTVIDRAGSDRPDAQAIRRLSARVGAGLRQQPLLQLRPDTVEQLLRELQG